MPVSLSNDAVDYVGGVDVAFSYQASVQVTAAVPSLGVSTGATPVFIIGLNFVNVTGLVRGGPCPGR